MKTYSARISRLRIVLNPDGLSMQQLKAREGCDVILAGHWWNTDPVGPVGHCKVDGEVLSREDYFAYGYAWNAGELPQMQPSTQLDWYDNFLCTMPLIAGGRKLDLYPDSWVARRTSRPAFGFDAEGVWHLVLFDAHNPWEVREYMHQLGCVDAMLFDGGGSTKAITPAWTWDSSRVLQNYICVWLADAGKETEDDMTETDLRNKVVQTAIGWLGSREGTDAHKAIIDLYNSHKPLARSYPVKYTDEWCAAFVSAVAIKCGLTDIMPTECGVERMARLYQALGRWEENDAYIPQPGDVLTYDWQAKATGDTTGWADHVGIVEKVEGNTIHVIEGNKGNTVARVTVPVDYRYIRGFGLPDYASKATEADKPVEKTEKELAREWVIEQGVSDGERPDDPVKRSELWRMLYRMRGGE